MGLLFGVPLWENVLEGGYWLGLGLVVPNGRELLVWVVLVRAEGVELWLGLSEDADWNMLSGGVFVVLLFASWGVFWLNMLLLELIELGLGLGGLKGFMLLARVTG